MRKDAESLREKLLEFLIKLEYLVPSIIVEGSRDVDALRRLGFKGNLETISQLKTSNADFVESLSSKFVSVVILTDFDEEGRRLNLRLSKLLERRGTKVERGLRREFGRLMASIGVYTIESLDNWVYTNFREF